MISRIRAALSRLRPIPTAIGLTVAFLLLSIVPLWVRAYLPIGFWRTVRVVSLWTLIVVFATSILVAPPAVILLSRSLLIARRRRAPRPILARLLLLCVLAIPSAILFELTGRRIERTSFPPPIPPPPPVELPVVRSEYGPVASQSFYPPDLPTNFESSGPVEKDRVKNLKRDVRILVVGESSARGEPYEDRLSVGAIVAKQLEKVYPGRKFEIDMQALPGIRLDQAVERLYGLRARPDAVIVYSGHNEFQGRYAWDRAVQHYDDVYPPVPWTEMFLGALSARSSFVRVAHATLERHRIDVAPPFHATRELIDHPVCSPAERERIVTEFELRLDGVVAWCEFLEALPILIIPAGNEGDYPPGRSILPKSTSREQREAFAKDFLRARSIDRADPVKARALYESLIAREPGFADSHYRLGKLLEASGEFAEAQRRYEAAREADAMPMRCSADLQAGYRAVAKKRGVVLVDGPAVLKAFSPDGVVDERLFHDAQHPKYRAYLAIAQDLLNQLIAREAFGKPTIPNPPAEIDPEVCAREFKLDRETWVRVCERSASFYRRTAFIRFDPTDSLGLAALYSRAAKAIAAGKAPEEVGIPGLGVNPPEFRSARRASERRAETPSSGASP